MSDILKRTIFIDDSGGMVRFHDWAVVNHALGTMMEPFSEIRRIGSATKAGISNFDSTDAMCRIDAIERLSLDKAYQILGGDRITGGNLLPRTGR
jgi:hypothetical protein